MQLRGIEFGNVFNASGARNFNGAGFWFHQLWRPFGLSYTGSTLVAKTTTLIAKEGHMPLKPDGMTPREWKPRCIKAKLLRGVVLNAVGLSGPGLLRLLNESGWLDREEPFLLSFMPVKKTVKTRAGELRKFVALLGRHLGRFNTQIGLQINFSCPNVGLESDTLIAEVTQALDIAAGLNIPLIPKFCATADVEQVVQIARHHDCDAICMSNTIPWGQLPKRINWRKLFGSDTSPLEHLGGGGLSGKPLLPIVCDWLRYAHQAQISKPIIGCGGILSRADAELLLRAGATAIELGSVSILRPWRVRGIIAHVNRFCAERANTELFLLTHN